MVKMRIRTKCMYVCICVCMYVSSYARASFLLDKYYGENAEPYEVYVCMYMCMYVCM